VGEGSGDQELGVLHHWAARGDGGDDPGDDRVCEEATVGHRLVPRGGAVPWDAVLLRGGEGGVVPEGDEVGAGGYGQGDGVGLSWIVSGAVVVLAEAGLS
jgi:hypothetical protein